MNKPITTKDLKVINDLNQVLKKVYKRYTIFSNGFIIPTTTEDSMVSGGIHFSIIPPETVKKLQDIFNLNLTSDTYSLIVELDASAVFKAIKDNKKDLSSLSFIDNHIYFQGKDMYPIGFVQQDSNVETYLKKVLELHTLFDLVELSEEVVESLSNNNMAILGKEEYKVRLTKEVIPNLKKDMLVHIGFRNDSEPTLFQIMIKTTKNDISSFHFYKCIRY